MSGIHRSLRLEIRVLIYASTLIPFVSVSRSTPTLKLDDLVDFPWAAAWAYAGVIKHEVSKVIERKHSGLFIRSIVFGS